MRIIKREKAEIEVLKDITCDCCGKSCKQVNSPDYEFAQIKADWGYYSQRDGDKWECDLCESCAIRVREFIESLGGKVRVENFYGAQKG